MQTQPSLPMAYFIHKALVFAWMIKNAASIGNVPLLIETCTGWFNQQFSFQQGTIFAIGSNFVAQRCVAILPNAAGNLVALQPVVTQACVANAQNQQWEYVNGELINPVTGLCIDGTTDVIGVVLIVDKCIGIPSQKWQIK